MQMFRPSNECYEQSYNHQSTVKPFCGTKPMIGYGGGNNIVQCQTQTQCFDAQLPGSHPGSGYGLQQHAAGHMSQGYGLQKPYGQYAQHGSHGSVQHGGTHGGATHQSSYGSMMQGGYGHNGSAQHGNMAHGGSYATGGYGHNGSAHQGSSFGSGCEGQTGGYSYTMKKREKRSWGRKRSGNDSDGSCSDESDNDH